MYIAILLVDISISFTQLPRNASFLIVKHNCVREKLSDVVFLLTQLQQITVQEHMFGDFTLAPLIFGSCTSPTDTFPFNYQFPSMSIHIPLNCSPVCEEDNFQQFQHQVNIFDNPLWIRCSRFWFPHTLKSSSNLIWCRETETQNPLLLVGYLPI